MAKKIERELSTKEKQMAAKILRDEYAMSFRKIAKALGISLKTAWDYVNLEITDDDKRYYNAVKKMITLKEDELSAQALQLLEQKMPRAQFRDLVGFYKVIRELRQPKVAIAQQFNIQPILGGASRDADNNSSQQNNPNRENS